MENIWANIAIFSIKRRHFCNISIEFIFLKKSRICEIKLEILYYTKYFQCNINFYIIISLSKYTDGKNKGSIKSHAHITCKILRLKTWYLHLILILTCLSYLAEYLISGEKSNIGKCDNNVE